MNPKPFYLFAALFAFLIFVSSSSYAQTVTQGKWRFSFGAEGGLPVGNIKDYSNFELGGTIRAQYGLKAGLALTFTSGYYNFFAKKIEIPGLGFTKLDDAGIIPVKVGIKSFLGNNFYWAAEAGAGFETPGGPVKLILSPGIGYATTSWDIGARYEHFTQSHQSFGMVALRAAYGF